MRHKPAASGVGISYMLPGEPPGSGVSNSNPYHEDSVNADDYAETGPYVMWKDTDYAHVMIPVDGG